MGTLGVERLRIESLRNIRSLDLHLGGKRVLFLGGNGAGKTTLLEAIYLLARGRSFRGRKSGDVTTVGSDGTRIVGDVRLGDGGVSYRLSFVRLRSAGTRSRGDADESVSREWGLRFPVRLIGEASCALLDGEPGVRRGFLDLNLFHVEPGGERVLRRFRRVLGQRNAWLRAGAPGRSAWDQEFLAASLDLDEARQNLFRSVATEFCELAAGFEFLQGCELLYRPGWKEPISLAEALTADRDAERYAGFTRVGPQRADFRVSSEAPDLGWSRGQAKVIVCLLQLACDRVQERASGYGSVWLLDDLWAELDGATGDAVVQLVTGSVGQCLFSRVLGSRGGEGNDMPADTLLFHVKQGTVVPLS